jgi:hypothetical protein
MLELHGDLLGRIAGTARTRERNTRRDMMASGGARVHPEVE